MISYLVLTLALGAFCMVGQRLSRTIITAAPAVRWYGARMHRNAHPSALKSWPEGTTTGPVSG